MKAKTNAKRMGVKGATLLRTDYMLGALSRKIFIVVGVLCVSLWPV